MTWHSVEARFTVGEPVLHAVIGPGSADRESARAAVEVRLEQLVADHPENMAVDVALARWLVGRDEVYAGTHTWTAIGAVPQMRLAARTYLTALAASFSDVAGFDLMVAEPLYQGDGT